MMKKYKYHMKSNYKNNKSEMNWSTTTINNLRLYLSMRILKIWIRERAKKIWNKKP